MSAFIPTGAATVVAMIGNPMAHAKMPALLNGWFADEGMNALMAPIDLDEQTVPSFFETIRGWNNCPGFILTAPHKQQAVNLVDTISDRAKFLNAVNIVLRSAGGQLHGDNLDGQGFVSGLVDCGFSPQGKSVALFGAGAGGAAIALALIEQGVSNMSLTDLNQEQADLLSAKLSDLSDCNVRSKIPVKLTEFDLIINATTVGVGGTGAVCSLASVHPDAMISDIVAGGEPTPWLAEAKEKGCRTMTGVEMARGQFQLMVGALGLAEKRG